MDEHEHDALARPLACGGLSLGLGEQNALLAHVRAPACSLHRRAPPAHPLPGTGTDPLSHAGARTGAFQRAGTESETGTGTGSGSGGLVLGGFSSETLTVADSGTGALTLAGAEAVAEQPPIVGKPGRPF